MAPRRGEAIKIADEAGRRKGEKNVGSLTKSNRNEKGGPSRVADASLYAHHVALTHRNATTPCGLETVAFVVKTHNRNHTRVKGKTHEKSCKLTIDDHRIFIH